MQQRIASALVDTVAEAQLTGWQAQAKQLFHRIDADSSGYLDQKELSIVVGKDAAENVLCASDANDDQRVDLSEWIILLSSLPDLERSNIMNTIGSTLAAFERSQVQTI